MEPGKTCHLYSNVYGMAGRILAQLSFLFRRLKSQTVFRLSIAQCNRCCWMCLKMHDQSSALRTTEYRSKHIKDSKERLFIMTQTTLCTFFFPPAKSPSSGHKTTEGDSTHHPRSYRPCTIVTINITNLRQKSN